MKETFALQVNGQPLATLVYVSPSFKLKDSAVQQFKADLSINGKEISSVKEIFEFHPPVLFHKILDSNGEAMVKDISFRDLFVATSIVDESLAILSQLNFDESGLDKLTLECF